MPPRTSAAGIEDEEDVHRRRTPAAHGVQHHDDRARRHDDGGEQRGDEPGEGDRHGDDVVAEGEREVLAGCGGGRRARERAASAARSMRSPRMMRSAALRLASMAEAGEIETWAAASAAASLRPSPIISTRWPGGAQGVELGDLAAGVARAIQRSMPRRSARARTGPSASPERSVTGRPAACRRATVSAASGRGASAKVSATAAASPMRSQAAVRVERARRRRPIPRGRGGRGWPPSVPSVPRPGCSAMSVDPRRADAGVGGGAGDGAGERVVAAGGERGGGGEGGGVEGGGVGQARAGRWSACRSCRGRRRRRRRASPAPRRP